MAKKTYVHPTRRVEVVGYESITSEPLLLWHKGRPVIVGRNGNSIGGKDTPNIGEYENESVVRIWFVRGTFDAIEFLSGCVATFNKLHYRAEKDGDISRRRFLVKRIVGSTTNELWRDNPPRAPGAVPDGHGQTFEDQLKTKTVRLLNWQPNDIGQQPEGSAFNGYSFPKEVMEALSEIKTWIENEKWFRSKGIPWRRGWGLYGVPGSGKSTLVRSIGMEFDLPVFVLDLSSLDNQSLSKAWQEIQQNAPAIALIEDIDSVFDGRQNIAAKNTTRDALTFDCLLNTISGVGNSDGVFLFITTNHIDKLDPALGVPSNGTSTRPGRIDRLIELNLMAETERRAVAQHILSDFPALIEPTVAIGNGETAAQFQHRRSKLALEEFWKEKI